MHVTNAFVVLDSLLEKNENVDEVHETQMEVSRKIELVNKRMECPASAPQAIGLTRLVGFLVGANANSGKS